MLQARLAEFASITPLSVTSSKRLAELMAGKAALIKEIMGNALVADMKAKGAGFGSTDLIGQYEAFKANLIHDITVAEFADIYAETIAYGLFAARLHDESLDTFTRTEALDLLPKSNPFLRALFVYIAGPNLDERLRRVVDDLCAVFLAADMEQVLRHFGKVTKREDPFLHFYETFLAEYNPAKRKARGVWYTPEPVVNFIVRAVDEVLKTEFGLADGLADTSRISVDWDTGQNDPKTGKPATIKKEVHRVQILDPATGTGTFLAEAVKLIAERVKGIAPGQWSNYVENDLIPRIHGFELLMASYAMCHMKLDMILTGLDYKPSDKPPRLGVYLTNSLEEGERVEQTLFGLSRAIADEAKAASDIKRKTPIMCVMGNPPYNISTVNNGVWIKEKIKIYKKGLSEKKINLDDDYIKFIRFAQNMIDNNGDGIIAMITNNSFLSGVTHRRMRFELMQSFQKITILNLHGDSNKKETSPDGSVDENVFDIRQGVSIAIFQKLHQSNSDCVVKSADLFGKRGGKYKSLARLENQSTKFEEIEPKSPYYFFTPKDFREAEKYDSGFRISDLIPLFNTGVKTDRDPLFLGFEKSKIQERFKTLLGGKFDTEFARKYRVSDSGSYKITRYITDVSYDESKLTKILYRPLDQRHIYYDDGIVSRAGYKVMRHVESQPNLLLVLPKYATDEPGATVADCIAGHKSFGAYDINYAFPLYLYPDLNSLDNAVALNIHPKLYNKIRKAAGLTGPIPAPDSATVESGAFRAASGDARPDEVKVFDYIYGVLHCPSYRENYAEFLKIDFPRVPFPSSPEMFRTLSEQGEALRRLHLMEGATIGEAPYSFDGEAPEGQDCMVDKPRFEGGKVWINGKGTDGQYFGNVPEVSWGFPIGGYQPAQKWLKDRKGRKLTYDDIRHYQKIIKILAETDRIMRGIEMPLDEGAKTETN
ncbi:type ISP restriction/modification enzyme [Pontixanthobacter gangjinensis]|nr:type ISP restriction/modification enzyme [Pontixanthobacter gangjinensis]